MASAHPSLRLLTLGSLLFLGLVLGRADAAAAQGICELPIDPGPCPGAISRWAKRPNGACIEFTYGGCPGNDNNFPSGAQCWATCPPPAGGLCGVPMDPGTCGSMATFWYADGSGGCHQYPNGCIGVPEGNAFASEAECQATCPATAEEICNLPAAAGGYVPGAGAVRWYSKANGLCDTFQYTGNDGNANNFYTEEDCYATCPAPPPVPALGGGRGPVAAALVLLMLAVAAALLRRSTDAKSGHSRAHSRAFRPIPFRNLPSPRCSSTP